MPKYAKKKHTERAVYESHYYRETKSKLTEILDVREKRRIDSYMASHNNFPPTGTARESGYSSLVFEGTQLEANTSMVDIERTDDDTTFILSRLAEAPKLPVSCIASTEHVVAQEMVEDFVSEYIPESKMKVMYQILVRIDGVSLISLEKRKLAKEICKDDDILTLEDVIVSYDNARGLFVVELGTQVTDIQEVIRTLQKQSRYHIESCNFEEININDGVCLLKADASNPIHALANIAQGIDQGGMQTKFFLERDAGSTTGKKTAEFQDSRWTFNGFQSLDDLRKSTGYPADAYAFKISKRP
ncbi:hypothetical protein [Legionella cardiaca]|uniref:Uncharacterized protein n=1 Tax=Legionella cardiaca TaxID=1071983 RepID=A0ABY8AP29_9GAMM|nr:hypothetical protein [Legionella cardiaca]WED42438.1 hypothetical protein PXX05_10995 [Legionella cardiaca]